MSTDYAQDALPPGMIKRGEALRGETQDERREEQAWEHQPIIGIPIPVQQGHQGPLLLADAVGAWAVERMSGRVFLIPLWPFPTHKYVYQSLWPLLQSMDGLLLPAGVQEADWSTHWKEGQSQPEPKTWPIAWEIALARLATYIGMPLLAIADGAEKWNCALGGKKREEQTNASQAVPTTPETWDHHLVRVRTQSSLASSIQPAIAMQDGEPKPWELAFMPHQGIEKVAPGLRPCAQSEDGAVVAFERRDSAFGLGMLGRLDWGLNQAYGTTIFDAFLRACQAFDRVRQHQTSWESSRDTICATVEDLVAREQSLLPVPQTSQEEKRPRSRPLSSPLPAPLPSTNGSTGQERFQRPHQPTKEELNRIRRQRLKTPSR